MRRLRMLGLITALLGVSLGSTRLVRAAPVQEGASRSMGPLNVGNLDVRPFVAPLPDGIFIACYTRAIDGGSEAVAIFSSDDGRSWSPPKSLFKFPKTPGSFGLYLVFVDRHGEVHLFFLNDAGTYAQKAAAGKNADSVQLHSDIWQAKSRNGRTEWEPPTMINSGFASHLNSVIQLRTGRMVIPFASLTNRTWGHRGDGFDAFTYLGQYDCTTIYSDDDGETWHKSSAALQVETPDLHEYGAVEPVVFELKDGRVWMLMRTQKGRLWESYSNDGVTWSDPQPTRFMSSDSPAGIVRIKDGRIVLFWNNCLRTSYDVGGRQALHAAISEDEGRTWRGYREVVRDPKRDEVPPTHGDWGTAYPFPIPTADGKILLRTGQGVGRNFLLLIDPAWLYETSQETNFSAGLEDWSTFATKGVELAANPNKPSARVLSIRKPEADWPAGAVWNFPMGAKGDIKLRLMVKPGFAGALIGLSDHFSPPFDKEDRICDLYNLEIDRAGKMADGKELQPNRWYNLQIDWDTTKGSARVTVDSHPATMLPLLRKADGVSYLRLRSTAATDNAGFLVESVNASLRGGKRR